MAMIPDLLLAGAIFAILSNTVILFRRQQRQAKQISQILNMIETMTATDNNHTASIESITAIIREQRKLQ